MKITPQSSEPRQRSLLVRQQAAERATSTECRVRLENMRAWRGTVAGNSGILVLLPGGDLPVEELTMQSIHGLPVVASLEEACDPRSAGASDLRHAGWDLPAGFLRVGQSPMLADGSAIVAAPRAFRWPTASTSIVPTHWMGLQARMAMAWRVVDDPDAVKPWFLLSAEDPACADASPRQKTSSCSTARDVRLRGTPLRFALRVAASTLADLRYRVEVGVEPTVRHAADLQDRTRYCRRRLRCG